MILQTLRYVKKSTVIYALILFFAGVLCSGTLKELIPFNSRGVRNETEGILYYVAPVSIDINFRAKLEPVGSYITVVKGDAEFTFNNTTDRPIYVAFPPQRVFQFNFRQYGERSTPPEFCREKRNVLIPARNSVTFTSPMGSTISGDINSYLRGGVGPIGFVFERPPTEDAEVEFCVGTVFPRYAVKTNGDQHH